MIRPIPVASILAAVLKRIKAGERQEEQAICGNVAIMSHCSAAMDLLRRKMGQWADTKNKESPSYRRRSAVFPIHNLARDMDNSTIWKNKERLMLECPIEFPVEDTQDAFTKAYASNSLWDDERRWHLWYFMEERV